MTSDSDHLSDSIDNEENPISVQHFVQERVTQLLTSPYQIMCSLFKNCFENKDEYIDL